MAERYCAEKIFFHAGQRTLIDDVSLTLSQGELVALIGPNGAGKSTLLRLLTGYLKPASGRCTLAGTPLADWPPDTLARYRAVMRQNTQPGFDWPVDAVVGMGRAPWTRSPEASVVEEVMAITGSLPLAGRRYSTLSGGEQQRIQLARALAQLWCDGAPRGWLFLDEPTSALDLYHQQHLLRLMKSLTRRVISTCAWCCTISIWRRCGRIAFCCCTTAGWSPVAHRRTCCRPGRWRAGTAHRCASAAIRITPYRRYFSPRERAGKNPSAFPAGHAPL